MRPALRLLLGLVVAMAAATGPAAAQQGATGNEAAPALLVADQVFITPERQLVAQGNVEVFQGDVRMRAGKIVFDRASGTLTVEGPIRIDQGDRIVVLASAAEMDRGLQNGLLTGARMVFDQQLQLAALQMTRVGGRYTELYKTAVTSCHVCKNGRPPLWQIRARRVTHDQLEKQLYFEEAQLRILDVPVFYVPVLRLPDPTLERATGFLIPSIRTTTQLDTGVRVPYFFKLGDHRDLTLAPYVSPKTRTLDFRYRQAFRRGRIQFEGAHTRDDLYPGEDRGYLFGTGLFDLQRDWRLKFDIKTTSDNAYLVDYGLPDFDRLRSEISLERVKRDAAIRFGVIHYNTLRDSDIESQIPTVIVDANYERRYFPSAIGGEVRLGILAHGHERTSTTDMLGRDVTRATFDVDWRRNWILASGIRADFQIGASVDQFRIQNDSSFPDRSTRTTPRTALTLRYPMRRVMPTGAIQYLEPIAQVGWTNASTVNVPNDESGFVEFDQGNLLSMSRFPAADRREDGATAVLGLNWARFAPAGWQASATIGQVFRQSGDANFTKSSGLTGTSSDILLAGQLKLDKGLSLTARGLLNNSLSFSKAEVRSGWTSERAQIAGTYLWLGRDAAENRAIAQSEIWLDGSYRVNPNWTASADLRYDIEGSRATRAGFGLIYQNECVTARITVSRRNITSASVEPTTDFGFTIALSGFAVNSGNKEYRRRCKNSVQS